MPSTYEIQQDTLKLFQGKATSILNQEEKNNLNIYKGLVLSNLESLLAKIYSEIYEFHKDKWREISQDYFERHACISPIYNKLCQKFSEYLESDFFIEKYGSNNYFAELAKYKWFDLEIYNCKEKPRLKNGFIQNYCVFNAKFNLPLIVNYLKSDQEISKDDDMEEEVTCLFIYRSEYQSRTLILNSITKEFIEELDQGKDLTNIKESFTNDELLTDS